MRSHKFALVRIPANLSFDDLHLALNPDSGTVEFDWAPLREIMAANTELTLGSDAEVMDLIGAWYSYLRLEGYQHEVAEQCLVSCEAEKAFGIGRMAAGPDTVH